MNTPPPADKKKIQLRPFHLTYHIDDIRRRVKGELKGILNVLQKSPDYFFLPPILFIDIYISNTNNTMIRRRRRRRHESNESSSYKNVVLAVLAIYTIYIIFLSSSFSLAPSHHHHQQQHTSQHDTTNKQSSPVPLSRIKNVASVRTCVSSPFFDPVFHAYIVSSKGDIISPLEIRRSLNTNPKKWVVASSSSSRTIPPPILRNVDSTNSTYEIYIDIHFEPVSMSEKHTVKLFVSYVILIRKY